MTGSKYWGLAAGFKQEWGMSTIDAFIRDGLSTVKTRYKKHFYKKLSRYKKLFGDDQLFTK